MCKCHCGDGYPEDDVCAWKYFNIVILQLIVIVVITQENNFYSPPPPPEMEN